MSVSIDHRIGPLRIVLKSLFPHSHHNGPNTAAEFRDIREYEAVPSERTREPRSDSSRYPEDDDHGLLLGIRRHAVRVRFRFAKAEGPVNDRLPVPG